MIYRHAQGDENALRVKYSLRYDLRPEFENRKWAVYLKYTGLFDFYTGTRPSGPVINRLSNIGLHWRQDSDVSLYGGQWRLQWYDIGVEHRSNGQTTDMRSEADFETARQAYARGDHRFFDGVSRGSNYLSAETRAQHSDKRLALYLKTKLYITSDNAVRWGPQSQQGLDISDFDRFTVGWTYTSKPELEEEKHRFLSVGDSESSLYWTVGDKGPRLSSLDLDYMRITRIEKWDISLPVYVRIHWGPMNNLSNYSERQTSIGVGFKFSPRW